MRLVTDDAGIARGGIRTGWVDVPVAALSGLTPPGATGIGTLLGSTRVFDATELARRYPAGRDEYAAAFREATTRNAAAGFVLAPDVDEMVAVATAAYPAYLAAATGALTPASRYCLGNMPGYRACRPVGRTR